MIEFSDGERSVAAAAEEAGRLLVAFRRGDRGAVASETKGDGTLVTEADRASDELLVRALTSAFPGQRIFTEERGRTDGGDPGGPVWIVDPLDGTRSFVEGRDDFSVLVARVTGSVPDFGVMRFPVPARTITARRGEGAYCGTRRLRVSPHGSLGAARLHLSKCALPGDPRVRGGIVDSGMAFFELASGAIDAVVIRMVTHKEWDVAAPYVVVTESGGRVTDGEGRGVVFDRDDIGYDYFVATNGLVHDEVLGVLPHLVSA